MERIITYTGIGSRYPYKYTETRFRNLIQIYQNHFNEPFPYDPYTENIETLVKWMGAEFVNEST